MYSADGRARVLADGHQMPVLGLGVWQVPEGAVCVNAVRWALDLGYRHIDTAQIYGNEASVGRALREAGVPREQVFITTKFYPGHTDPVAEAEQSLRRLGVDYVDLYLVHWPQGGPVWAWPGMERSRERGLARSVGVSNFGASDLAAVMNAGTIPPAVNQVQLSPVYYRRALLDACRERGVLVVAYSSLGTGRHLEDGTVKRVARRVGRPPHRCCCAGACSMISWSSPSRSTTTGSARMRRSSTSPCRRRTWPNSTRWTAPKAPTGRVTVTCGEAACGASARSCRVRGPPDHGRGSGTCDQNLARTPSATSSGLRSIRASPQMRSK